MSDAKTQTVPFTGVAEAAGQRPAHHILTLGNRAAFEIGRRLAIGWNHDHIWHATWPSLGGDPLPLTQPLSGPAFVRMRAEATAEADKSLIARIAAAPWDVILMPTGVHADTHYAVDGTRCAPDFTELPWLTDIDLAGARRPKMAEFAGGNVRHAFWLDAGFADIAKAGFARFHEKVLKARVDRGARVVVYRQIPTNWVLTPKGVERKDLPNVGEMRALSNELADFAARLPGVVVVDTPDHLNFTSDEAADGRGMLNAIDELYVEVACRVGRLMGDTIGERIVGHQLLEMRRERIALEWQAVGDTRQRERDLETIVRSLIDRSAMLERDMLALKRTLSWRVTKPLRAVRTLMRRPASKAP